MAGTIKATKRSGSGRLVALLRPHLGRLAIVSLLLALLAVTNMAVPFCLKLLVDEVFPSRSSGGRWNLIWLILPAVAVIYVMRNALFLGGRTVATDLGADIGFKLRRTLFEHLQRMSLSFCQGADIGPLGARIMDDTRTVLLFVQDRLPTLVVNAVMLVALLAIIYAVDWPLAIVSTLVLPLHFLTYRYFIRPIRQSHAQAQESVADAYGSLVDRLLGMEIVKSFSAERRECMQFASQLDSARRSDVRSRRLLFSQKVAADLLVGVATVGLLGFGAWQVTQQVMTTGDFFMFFGYIMMLYPTVLEVLTGSSHLGRAAESMERIDDLLRQAADESDALSTHAITTPLIRGAIEFHDVHFRYGDGPAVLTGLSLAIQPGEHVAIVGRSGTGKSTMMSLLSRFNTPGTGKVLLDGRDVAEWPLASLRGAIGVAFQEVFLFNCSILENVLYGRYEATVHEVIEACRITGAHEFIERLPVGYGTMPSTLGNSLSRGEKQRITLARAILKDPSVLILDEATASIDPKGAAAIISRIFERLEGRTVILVTHDPHVASIADRIVTIKEGGAVVADVTGDGRAGAKRAEAAHRQARAETQMY